MKMKIKYDLVALDTLEFPVSHAALPGSSKSLCGMARGVGLRKVAGKAPECRVCARAVVRLQETEDKRAMMTAGVSVLTRKDANRLRGLIAHHAHCQFNTAFAGAQRPEDARMIREEAARAQRAVYDELLRLTRRE